MFQQLQPIMIIQFKATNISQSEYSQKEVVFFILAIKTHSELVAINNKYYPNLCQQSNGQSQEMKVKEYIKLFIQRLHLHFVNGSKILFKRYILKKIHGKKDYFIKVGMMILLESHQIQSEIQHILNIIQITKAQDSQIILEQNILANFKFKQLEISFFISDPMMGQGYQLME